MSINDIERARSALNALDPGCPHDEWIRIGIASKAGGLHFTDFLEWSRPAPNFKSEKDCRTAWDSFKPNGPITVGTLFWLARQQGWSNPDRSNRYQEKYRRRGD